MYLSPATAVAGLKVVSKMDGWDQLMMRDQATGGPTRGWTGDGVFLNGAH